MKIQLYLLLFITVFTAGCFNYDKSSTKNNETSNTPFLWENAQIYFLLTDRFNNGNLDNDVNFDRTETTATLRGFMGGDIKGVTQKLEEGYFNDLGVQAIWFTPVVEQVHGAVDEGTGNTYGYHGYWTKDWTALDPNFGTEADLAEMIATAHRKGIRVLVDAVINHTGPVTSKDPVWPEDWVRTEPTCTYQDYASTVNCTLVENLPDVKTERSKAVDLPPYLVEKWKSEGRYEKEIAELDAFFERTAYPRTPRFYIIKWLTDFIRQYGIDGYRVDTAKHTEEDVWEDLRAEAEEAFKAWKEQHPDDVLDNAPFYMVGEVYNFFFSNGRAFDYGDKKVDFFDSGFTSLINFDFKQDAKMDYEALFSKYSKLLNREFKGKTVVNYISSHDDSEPFDKTRKMPLEAATKLLLCPGSPQTYYGDETARSLTIEGTQGDATLRSFMNWAELSNDVKRANYSIKEVQAHWQRLGQFRAAHPAVGAGEHRMLSEKPYVFSRTYTQKGYSDEVIIGLEIEGKEKEIFVANLFEDGTMLRDYYSGKTVRVNKGKVTFESDEAIVLLGK